MAKLKELLGEAFDDTPKVDKHKVIEGVRNFGIVGKSLYNNGNIMEVAKQLAEIAESAHHHILGENDDWFDKISVNKNMKSLKSGVMEFQKTAKEAHMLNQRLTGLYEDIGHVLNRYYDIDEVIDEADKGDMDNDGVDEPDDKEYMDNKDKAIKKAMKKEDKGDMDNDGKDEPDDEEYLQNKDKAIKKAMKEYDSKLPKLGSLVNHAVLGLHINKK
tara:strand:+ start:55 stop:702 length:648 start_codon:yes stop_codon:yes gene_type:complete